MTFREIFDRVIGHEGGYVNDPNDPGGETNWGISKRAYPNVDIFNLTKEQAYEIYKRDFWEKIQGDTLHPNVAFHVFDFAVNSGIVTAIRYYQRALGVADDGNFGPMSLDASATMSDTDQILRLSAERLDFMTRLKNWPTASKGWVRRIAQNLRFGAIDT